MKAKLQVLDLHTLTANDDVSTALSLLRDALGDEQKRINNEGAIAMQDGDYGTATSVIEFAKRLLTFQEKVKGLVAEWSELEDLQDASSPEVREIVSKRFFGRRKKGEITPPTVFIPYLLRALMEMGGSGKTKVVIDRVGVMMKDILKPVDYERLNSPGRPIRWRNNTQWARDEMANRDGRMLPKKKTGIWEISDKGRKWLKENSK